MWGGRERAFSNTTFLVCVHNVSDAQPYAILRAPVSSTAQDIIVQVLHKARRMEAPEEFVLIEELGGDLGSGGPESSPPAKISVSSSPFDSPSSSNFKAFRNKASLLLSSQLRDRSPSSASGRSWMSSVSGSARSDTGPAPIPGSPRPTHRRILLEAENVCALQNAWKTHGRFPPLHPQTIRAAAT